MRTLIFLTKKKKEKKEKVTRKYVITFTPSTAGNIFGDYSLKFRVTRHSSPLPIVPTRSNISTRYRRVIPLPPLAPIRICLFLEFSQGPEKCGENWAGWQQQRESGNNNEIRSLEGRDRFAIKLTEFCIV